MKMRSITIMHSRLLCIEIFNTRAISLQLQYSHNTIAAIAVSVTAESAVSVTAESAVSVTAESAVTPTVIVAHLVRVFTVLCLDSCLEIGVTVPGISIGKLSLLEQCRTGASLSKRDQCESN